MPAAATPAAAPSRSVPAPVAGTTRPRRSQRPRRGSRCSTAAAARRRSVVSYQSAASSSATRRCRRTRSDATGSTAVGDSTQLGLRHLPKLTMSGRPAPPPWPDAPPPARSTPASSSSARRHAAATTGLVAGRRPAPVSAGAAISSARRSTVSTDNPATPARPATPRARTRRAITPQRFVGTRTLTGASGSPPLTSPTTPRSASYAAAPYPVHITGIAAPRTLRPHSITYSSFIYDSRPGVAGRLGGRRPTDPRRRPSCGRDRAAPHRPCREARDLLLFAASARLAITA